MFVNHINRRFVTAVSIAVAISVTMMAAISETEAATNKNVRHNRDKRADTSVRIGHYQCICHQGDFEKNLQTVIHGLELAVQANLDIVSFPESLLTGYFRDEKTARKNSFSIDSPEIERLLKETARFDILYMVGFNELREGKLHNTIVVIEKGKLLGHYCKAFPIFRYFVPGREFPVFEKKGLKFGIVICADGGYVEPARILALKGARFIFAPHFNSVADPIEHFQVVRSDHIARAIENGVYFLRGNNIIRKKDSEKDAKGRLRYGYGDSYVINPRGAIVAGAGLYNETLMIYNLNLNKRHRSGYKRSRNFKSANALLGILQETLKEMK